MDFRPNELLSDLQLPLAKGVMASKIKDQTPRKLSGEPQRVFLTIA
jgi:hypothetical protein